MSILFLANNTADFLQDASAIGLSDSTTTYAREADFCATELLFSAYEYTASPFTADLGSEEAEIWLHCRVQVPNNSGNAGANGEFINFIDGNGVTLAAFDLASGGEILATTYADAEDNGSSTAVTDNTTYVIDIHITVGASTVDMDLYSNGSLISSASSANTTLGAGGVKLVEFSNDSLVYVAGGSTSDLMAYSEIIITDTESTIGWRLAVLTADTDGDHTDWQGGAAEAGDLDLSTALSAGTNGDKASFNPTSYVGPASASGIRAVVAKCSAAHGDTGPESLRQFLRISSTDYEGDQHSLSLATENYMEEWAVNPNTSLPWSTTDLASLQLGLKAET